MICLVIPVYNIYNGTEQLGHVAVCIRLNAFSELLPAQSTFTTACGVYNRDGQAVMGYGDYPQGYPSGENTASARHLLSAPLSFGGWRIACLVSGPLLFQTAAVPMLVILVGMVIIVVGLVVFLRAVSGQLLAPMNQLIEGTERIGAGDFTKRIEVNTKDEFHALAQAFNSMQDNIQRYIRQRVEYEQHIKDMEIQRLMLQITPHFIYNTLDSIVFMAQIAQQKNIVEFTRSFISLLHNTLLISDDPGFTTVETELANIRHYLVLQQYRYPDKINVVYDVDPQAAFCRIPGLFLLTLVENAIFHGICPKEGKGTLCISVHCSGEFLTLGVTDDGVGMPPEKTLMIFNEEQSAGHRVHRIGLNNIQQRIHQLYGEAYGLSIESQLGKGTCATVRLPYERG